MKVVIRSVVVMAMIVQKGPSSQCIPRLAFPGGCLVGCTAGFLNVAKLKGTHNAIGSGMQAAESIHEQMESDADAKTIHPVKYDEAIRNGPIMKELKAVRNVRPSFHMGGLWAGFAYTGLFYVLGRGVEPWTLSYKGGRLFSCEVVNAASAGADHTKLQPANDYKKIDYPKPDGKVRLSF